MYLLDTDILIDYLRLHKPAIGFLESLDKKDRNIAFITQFELSQGCKSKLQEQKVCAFLKNFKVISFSDRVARRALGIYRAYRWATNMDIPDTFIAASAIEQELTVLTRNIKHYKSVPQLKAEKPY